MVMVNHINRAVTKAQSPSTKELSILTAPVLFQGLWTATPEPVRSTFPSPTYFTILVYKDLMWIADDGGNPKVLPFLTPQLPGQIVPVWRIQTSALVTPRQIARALPAPETPDYDPPLHGTPPKKAKFTQDKMRLHVANITSFGRRTLDWYWSRDNELYVFVETHLDSQKHHSMCQYFEVRGRHAFGYPAHNNPNNEGNHGGILILYDTAHGLSKVENFDIEGCGYQAFLWEAKARSLLVIAVYFKTNENLQGPTNSKLLARILALIDATNRQATVLSSKFHWQILAPDATLLNGNTLDYAIMHQNLAPLAACSPMPSSSTRTSGSTTSFAAFLHCPMCRTLGFEHGAPMAYVSQVEDIQLYDTEPNAGDNISSNNIHGHHKAELQILQSSTNHLYLPSPVVYGKMAIQHTGNNGKHGSTSFSASPTKPKEPPEAIRLSKMHHNIGPETQPGRNSWTPANTGNNTRTHGPWS